MDSKAIAGEVRQEIQRLQKVLELLEGGSASPKVGSSPQRAGIKRKGHKWSPAKRAEMSKKLKAAWAARKAGKGKK